MKHNYYYPLRQADQVAWLANFKDKLPGYATALSLVTGAVTAAVADCGWLEYILDLWLLEARAWLKSCTGAAFTALKGQTVDRSQRPEQREGGPGVIHA